MQFEILGSPRVMVDGDPLPLGSPQQQKLLALLLVSPNRAISTDRLIDELWGDDPPPSARHLVQVYASRLRNVLGSDGEGSRISHENDGYLVRVRPEDVDALSLSSRIPSARALLATDPAGAARELQAIVALRRGQPFGNLADDCPTLQAEAVGFEESYLEAVTCLAEARLELGHHAELIPELEKLTREHPYREQLWAQRMLALYRSGRQAEALRTYQQLSRVLGDDLGIEPSTEVRHLEERILLQDVGLLWEVPPPPNNLPTPLTSFVGRDAEIAEIAKLVDTFRLTTLTGPGGIGKTRLAIEVAQRLQLQFPDGIWWVDLAPVGDPGGVEIALARVLGVTEQPGTALVDSLVRALLRREALVVMDNCEHLASAVADLFTALLREAGGIRILATSRLLLHVPGEVRWSVPSLSMPHVDELTTAALPAADAIGLFIDRGTAADPGFALTAENGAEVIEICRQLDAMPLAIEMAAARVRVLAPAQIVTALADRFDLLGQRDHGVEPRHQTLKGAIDWSYQLLEPRDRRAFERLSVFAGSFDLEAAAAVARPGKSAPRMVDSITALLEASMVTTVRLEPSVIHYRMLETLRAYGARLLDERGETDRSR
jgi:predicted ATPase/DNA-binding SARP family transcriptional activator